MNHWCISAICDVQQMLDRLDNAAAVELVRQCKLDLNAISGDNDEEKTKLVETLAEELTDMRVYDAAAKLYEDIRDAKVRVLGDNHPDVSLAMNNLALVYQDQDRHKEAKVLLEGALSIDTAAHGENHPEVAAGLTNLAETVKAMGNYELAEKHLKRAIKIGLSNHGPNHPDLATRYNNLAGVYFKQGKIQEAWKLYKWALQVTVQSLGPNHPTLAIRLNNMAGLMRDIGKYEDAIQIYERAQQLLQSAPSSSNTALLETIERNLLKAKAQKINAGVTIADESQPGISFLGGIKRPRDTLELNGSTVKFTKVQQPPLSEEEEQGLFKTILSKKEKFLDELLEKIKDKRKDVTIGITISGHTYSSPLHLSCAMGDKEITKRLIDAGFSLEVMDENGRRPFHFAVASGVIEVVAFLWETKKTLHDVFRLRDKSNQNALEWSQALLESGKSFTFSSKKMTTDQKQVFAYLEHCGFNIIKKEARTNLSETEVKPKDLVKPMEYLAVSHDLSVDSMMH